MRWVGWALAHLQSRSRFFANLYGMSLEGAKRGRICASINRRGCRSIAAGAEAPAYAFQKLPGVEPRRGDSFIARGVSPGKVADPPFRALVVTAKFCERSRKGDREQ